MDVGNVSPKSTATAVWNNATRTITSLGGALLNLIALEQTLATSTAVNVTPSGTGTAKLGVGAKAGAAGTFQILYNDGTLTFQLLSIAAGANGGLPCIIFSAGFNVRLVNNDATNAATYSYAHEDLQ